MTGIINPQDEEQAIEDLVHRLTANGARFWSRMDCKSCDGFGIVEGDRVEYWGAQTSLPGTICDCTEETAWRKISAMLATGELYMRYGHDGKPFIGGTMEAGLTDD